MSKLNKLEELVDNRVNKSIGGDLAYEVTEGRVLFELSVGTKVLKAFITENEVQSKDDDGLELLADQVAGMLEGQR